MMTTLILPGKIPFYGFRKLYLHCSECDGDTTLDDNVPEDPEDETLDVLDEDFENNKREVALQFPNMEKETFVRSLQFLQTHNSCKEIITDASTSICKEMSKP